MAARFSNKTILVTGGNSGIGYAVAKQIINEGGKVIITGRDPESLRRAQMELGPNSEAIRSDSGNLKDITALFDQVKQKHGQIDGLFANAGIAKFAPVEMVSEEEFDSVFDVNVKGVFFTMQKAVPLLKPGSSVVLNASVAASRGGAFNSVYAASKAAVRSMARTFSAAYVSQGIRFNAVSPGPIETPIWSRKDGTPNGSAEGMKAAIAEANPMKRYGTPEEVSAAVAFLLSSESSYVLGAELFIDGGANQL